VNGNRRRIRGRLGRRLVRQCGERIERSFVRLHDTGGMRRTTCAATRTCWQTPLSTRTRRPGTIERFLTGASEEIEVHVKNVTLRHRPNAFS
jgi:hypothetical protein